MLQYANISIDGAKVRAAKGNTVLDTALAYGTCIPHLCHMPNFTALGACRLCIVEVVKNGRAKVTTSCTLDVQDGMVVLTNSDKIRRLRRNQGDCVTMTPMAEHGNRVWERPFQPRQQIR